MRDADQFFEDLLTGDGLRQGHPVFAFRRALINARQTNIRSKNSLDPRIKLGMLIKTWNAYASDASVDVCFFRSMSERFPIIAGVED